MVRPLDILVGCEQSRVVASAFGRLGHNAWSCDLLPSDVPSNRHIIGDVRDVMRWQKWDLLFIAHPPCTRLCNSGVRWLTKPPKGRTLAEMWAELDEGAALFSDCWNAEIPCVAIENPVMHKHAKALIANFQPAAQTVQPWWFGDPAFKATGLYLRGLPKLTPTNRLTPPRAADEPERHKAWSAIHRASPGADRWKIRSKTFPGFAAAMAMQWAGDARDEAEREAAGHSIARAA